MAKATTKATPKKDATAKLAAAKVTAAKATAAKPASAKPKAEIKAPPKPTATAKPKAAAKPKVTKVEKGVLKQTSDAISQLASDILADRIVPTIEQIKSIAASALGQDQTKGKRKKK